MADVTQVVDLGLEDEPNGAEQEEDAIQIPVAELHILHKDKPPETQPLFPGVNNIGRSQDSNQVWINETCVSKQHASLEIKNGMYFLKDLRSTNTTRLVGAECGGAGVQLEPYVQYQLSDGYHFSLGGLLCRFEAFKSTAQDAHSPFQVPQRRIKPLPDTPQLTFSPPGLALPSDGTSSPQRDRSLRKTDRESAKPKALFVEEGDEAEDSFLAPSPLNRSAIFRLESEEEEEEYCETQVYNRPTSSKQPTSDNYDVTSGLALPSNLLEADDGSEEQPTLAYDEDQATTSATKTAVEEVDLSSTLAYDDDMLQQEEEKGSAKPSRKAMSGTLCQMATEGASGVEATQMYGDEGEEPNNTLVYDKEESEEEYGATLAYGADDVVAEAAATLAYDSGSNREEAQRKELEDADATLAYMDEMCDKASEVSATLIYETAEEQEEKREVAEQEAEAPTLAYEAGLLGDREALSATLAYDESAAVDAKGFHTSKSTAHHQEDAHMTQVYDKIEETCAEPTLRYDDGGGDADGNQEDKGPECSDDGGGDDDATEMCAPTQIYEPALPQEGHSIVNDEIETIGSIEKFETTTDISADVAVDELLNQMVSANSSVVHENEEDRDSSPTSFVGLVLPYTNDGNDTDGGDGDGGDVGDSELHSITEKSNMVEDVADKKEEGEKEEEEDATQLPTDNEDVMEVSHQDNKENEQAHSTKGEPADTTITTLRSVPEEDQIFGSSTQLYSLPESVPLGEVMHSSPEDRSGTSRVEASLEDEDGEEETSKYTGASLCILSQVAESTSWDTTDERYKADENNSSKRKRVASIPPTQESKRSAEADERANKKQRCDDGDRGRNNGAESDAVPQHSLHRLQQKIKEESEEVVEASAEEEDWPLDNVTKDGHEEPQRETGTGVIHEKIKVESTKRGGGRRKQTEAKSSAKAPKQKGTNRKVGKNEESTSLLRAKEEEDEEENVAKSGRKTRTKEKKVKAPCRAIKGKRMASKPSSCEPSLIEIPRVMFTGIVDPKRAKVIADLGGKIVEDPHQSTHLVTDKVHRTIKFLACMGRGNAIVSFRWIDKCNKEGFFVEETPFFLKDMAGERKWNFSLPASLQFARSRPLLQGLSFYASLHTRPDPESLGVIVTAAGGRMVGKPEQPYSSSSDSNVIIISCAEDEDVWRPLHDQKGYPIYTTEFILLGILQQRLEWESNLLVRHQQDLESQPDQSLASPKSRRGRRRR